MIRASELCRFLSQRKLLTSNDDLIGTGVNMNQAGPTRSPAADTADVKAPPKSGSLGEVGSMAETSVLTIGDDE